MRNIFLSIICCFFVFSCQETSPSGYAKAEDPQHMTAIEGDYLNMIVTTPAGSTRLLHYQASRNAYETMKDSVGQALPPTFLPLPANYGFLPGTERDSLLGTELEVLLLSDRQATGSLIPVRPIAVIRLLEKEEAIAKIIALPVKKEDQPIQVDNFLDFAIQYDAAKQIIETWLLNYKGSRTSSLIGWEDESYAWQLVKSRTKKTNAPQQNENRPER